MTELNQQRTEALLWEYFRVIPPVGRRRLKELYKAAVDRMGPAASPSNTKAGLDEMKSFYFDFLEANPEWAFKEEPPPPRPAKRPRRGASHRPRWFDAERLTVPKKNGTARKD
jgi:hypothetical protein